MRTTNIRFTGMASGLDTESMVQALTMPYKMKVDTSKQQKMLLEMQKDKYKEISNSIRNFTDKWAGNVRLTGSFNKSKVTVSDTSKVEVNTSNVNGSFTIDEVTKMAKSASLQTTSVGKTKDKTMGDLGITFEEGKEIILKVSDSVDEAGKPIIKEIKLTQDMTIEGLERELKNNLTNSNVSFDNNAKGFFISSKKTGASQKIDIVAAERANGVDAEKVGILTQLGLGTGKAQGENLEMKFNGMSITSETNTVTVNGIEIKVKDTFTNANAVQINSEADNDAIFNYVKEFITEYNKLVTDLNKMISVKPNKDYKPLLEEQKAEMSETDIEQWNKKIEESLMSNNKTVEKILGDMRGIMGSIVDGLGVTSLHEIGISTGSWKDKGVLQIDETKLRKAIEENVDGVVSIFSGSGDIDGIADKLYKSLNDNFKSVTGIKSATSVFNDVALDKKIRDEDTKAFKLEEQRLRMEDMQYKKFTAMEKMLQQLNSQSGALFQQMGGM
ncbi:MAG: flagellar filament capping protein FliD [Cellulosilyticaceae bacterium]